MTTINVDTFLSDTLQWAQARNQQFRFNWPVKGGWEGWIQVDLTAFILSLDSTAEILREQPIYTSTQKRTDLLLNTSLTAREQIPVEIKAESFENRGAFVGGVVDDIEKLNLERNRNYSQATCIMLALPFSPESLDRVMAIQQDGHAIFVRFFVGEVACVAAVWVASMGWLHPQVVAAEEMEGQML
jgi:hypothetical protein